MTDSVQRLQDELVKLNQDIDTTDKTLNDSKASLVTLNQQKVALTGALSALQSSSGAITTAQTAAVAVASDSQAAYTQNFTQLDSKLGKAQKDAISKAVQGVDAVIAQLLKASQDAQAKADAAAADSAKANQDYADSKAAYQAAQAGLAGLPAQIQTGQAKVTQLKNALVTAVGAGKNNLAYYLTSELKSALADLAKLTDSAMQTSLEGTVADKLDAMNNAQAAAAQKLAAAVQMQQAAAAANQDYQQKVQSRAKDIQANLPADTPAAATTTASATPVATATPAAAATPVAAVAPAAAPAAESA